MKLAKLVLPCLLVLACHSPVKADSGLGLAYLFGYGGYGGFGGARLQSYSPAPPYFALHPPVYYGERFTRPYGASPFAAWPQLQPSSAYAPQPHVSRAQTIGNAHFGSAAVSAPAGTITQVAPAEAVIIENPYFQPEQVYTSAQ